MNLDQLFDRLKNDPVFMKNAAHWKTLPAIQARFSEWPENVHPSLINALEKNGVSKPWFHQAEAFNAINNNQDVVVETPTASGKTLCYNLPVLNRILNNSQSRALYLFPTKALSQDQLAELHSLIKNTDADIKAWTFDGDTPQNARKAIRTAGHIVVTNPDMLHSGILPHHTKWVKLFENLEFIVIDEIHQYRGVFGSHMANVMERLKRVANFYGSNPRFICLSATISNPAELASAVTGRKITAITESGAPTGDRHFILYNPPVVNTELNIRRSVVKESARLAATFILNNIPTIVFARSRLRVEVINTYLKKALKQKGMNPDKVCAYRGGYLPGERRRIEKSLRDGSISGVVSTNALELGIDIGALTVSVMCGYPGSIASALQQAGRAGRKKATSLAVLVASSTPLDQYMLAHPDYFFEASPEQGIIDPQNLIIRYSHLKCASFELPFRDGEEFSGSQTASLLGALEEHGVLRHRAGRWFWMEDSYPAGEISLRSAATDNFVVVERVSTEKEHINRVIAEVDYPSAPMLIHDEAIYLHQGRQYHVDELDFDRRTAYVHEVDVDYYTDAETKSEVRVIDVFDEAPGRSHGEVLVSFVTVMYKKIRFNTHENVGWGHVHLPQQEMHTSSWWLSIPPETEIALAMDEADMGTGLKALATVLTNILPVFLMCDPRDISAVPMVRSPHTGCPTLFFYDCYPGGVGLARRAYQMAGDILRESMDLLRLCPCRGGCPSCCGPIEGGKSNAVKLLESLIENLYGE